MHLNCGLKILEISAYIGIFCSKTFPSANYYYFSNINGSSSDPMYTLIKFFAQTVSDNLTRCWSVHRFRPPFRTASRWLVISLPFFTFFKQQKSFSKLQLCNKKYLLPWKDIYISYPPKKSWKSTKIWRSIGSGPLKRDFHLVRSKRSNFFFTFFESMNYRKFMIRKENCTALVLQTNGKSFFHDKQRWKL